MNLVDEAAKTDKRSRNSWIEVALSRAVVQRPIGVVPDPPETAPSERPVKNIPYLSKTQAQRAVKQDEPDEEPLYERSPAMAKALARKKPDKTLSGTMRQVAGQWAWFVDELGLNGGAHTRRDAERDAEDKVRELLGDEDFEVKW